LNEIDRAVKLYEAALSIAREIGDQSVEAELLNSLGDAYLDAGNAELALNCYEQRLKSGHI
jgi:tetratricopeptide (TPR) repeat protein